MKRPAATNASTSGTGRGRKRATLACQVCHQRKVRCNVTQSGPPCVNCLGDGIKCEIVARGRGLRRHRLVTILGAKQQDNQNTLAQDEQALDITLSSPYESPVPAPPSPALRTPESVPETRPGIDEESTQPESTTDLSTQGACDKQLDTEQRDEDDGFGVILDDREENEGTAFMYTGDQQGLGLVVDICKPHHRYRGNHFIIPRAAAMNSLLPEDLAALHAKDCFSLPPPEVQEQLLRCYFHHVHPFLPILNVSTFIHQYEAGGPRKVNLLLLWSMFFASTNFLDEDAVGRAGYSSRKAMKRSLYRKAKALYDADYEKDKIPLIQSVLLLAFWYADQEDRDGSWHWIGIAISLCQTIGLHRNPHNERPGLGRTHPQRRRALSEDQCRVWRLIWWMCYFRDTWLSFGMGRPARINLLDCDMPVPTAEDVELIGAGVSGEHASKYLPGDYNQILPRIWACLLETTFALGGILSSHYRAKPLDRHPTMVISQDQDRLRQCRLRFPTEEACDNPIILSHLYHLYVYYEACVIALHRPYMAGRPGEPSNSQDDAWKAQSLQKAKIAASNINSTLNKMSASQMINSCHAMMVTGMIPALQIHLLESVSGNSVSRYLGRNHLDISLIILSELRRTYWAADFMYSLFNRARSELDSITPPQTASAKSKATRPAGSTTSPMTPSAPNASFASPGVTNAGLTPSHSATPNPATEASNDSCGRQENEQHLEIPLDIDLALAYDLFPLNCDPISFGTGLEGGNLSAAALGNDAPFEFDMSDTDMNVLFDGESFRGLSQ